MVASDGAAAGFLFEILCTRFFITASYFAPFPESHDDEYPLLEPGQASLMFAEIHTGIIINLEEERCLNGDIFRKVFDSAHEAELFAQSHVNNHPDIECHMYDEKGVYLKLFVRHPHLYQ
ncbi:MAG: hypothetical protein ABIR47_16370 [Candidatus Kapaibacterium sp.]